LDGLVDVGDGAHDEFVETASDLALPAQHSLDVGLYRGAAVALRDLRVAAGKKFHRLRGADRLRLWRCLARFGRLRSGRPGRGLLGDSRRFSRCLRHYVTPNGINQSVAVFVIEDSSPASLEISRRTAWPFHIHNPVRTSTG